VSEELTEALRNHLERLPDDSGAWLFPSDRDSSAAITRWTMDKYLREAYLRARLEPFPGTLWHAFRRKWATERKNMPLNDVAAAGGWKDVRTLLKSYQKADSATLERVVLNAPKLMRSGLASAVEVTPQVAPLAQPDDYSPG
jgi:integrase